MSRGYVNDTAREADEITVRPLTPTEQDKVRNAAQLAKSCPKGKAEIWWENGKLVVDVLQHRQRFG